MGDDERAARLRPVEARQVAGSPGRAAKRRQERDRGRKRVEDADLIGREGDEILGVGGEDELGELRLGDGEIEFEGGGGPAPEAALGQQRDVAHPLRPLLVEADVGAPDELGIDLAADEVGLRDAVDVDHQR